MLSTAFPETLFFDLEVIPAGPDAGKVFRWASLCGDALHQGKDVMGLFEQSRRASFLCAHNLLGHDALYLPKHPENGDWCGPGQHAIDTLYLSTLLFAEHPYHRLSKDYRLSTADANDPVEDVRRLQQLFWDCVEAWQSLPEKVRVVYRSLLANVTEFSGFFYWVRGGASFGAIELAEWIQEVFRGRICVAAEGLLNLIQTQPVALAYAFALVQTSGLPSIHPAWLLQRYPEIQNILRRLRGEPCELADCSWCRSRLDPQAGLKSFFGFEDFRSYEGINLQEQIVRASLKGESLLAILPTGGGKSLTFQLPALMQGEALRALTVVISPLQSLMKDQVDSLSDKFDIEGAVTLNGTQSATERKLAIEAVESGTASLLYISPEALRSNTVLRLLKARSISRFVIDEAHCFSEWGQDFRVDYLYLARFLNMLQQLKGLSQPIPVSCFTATAKQAVQQDILTYFKERLQLELKVFSTLAQRTNLSYRVFAVTPEEKYSRLRILLSERTGPKIVYASTTRTVEELAGKLQRDGLVALPFHGRMDRLTKLGNMEAFMQGQLEVIVATSAFGMGVDKDNVEMVIHYEISDSLEDYLQEAGRAGRRADLEATCCILFDENDLERHFQLLNGQRLNQKEINQVWAALKKLKLTQFSRSTLEIARDAGWNLEQQNLETRVKSALAALEEAGLLERNQNDTLILAGYFATCPVEQANRAIGGSLLLTSESDKITAKRVFQYLLSRASLQDKQDLKFDWMCEHLGLETETAHRALNALRQEGLIHSQSRQHITLFTGKKDSSRARFEALAALERRLVELLNYGEVTDLPYTVPLSLKEVNHLFKQEGIASSLEDLRQILRHAWEPGFVSRKLFGRKKEEFLLTFHKPYPVWKEHIERRLGRSERMLDFLDGLQPESDSPSQQGLRTVAFALPVLKAALESQLFDTEPVNLHTCDQLLLQLHKLRVFQAEDGVALYYTRMRFSRHEDTQQRRFTKAHYQRLEAFYKHKVQQIHIVGDYARRMLLSPSDAQAFSNDYFQLEFKDFLKKYFKGHQDTILRPMTQRRWEHVFGALSKKQNEIIADDKHQRILVAAGPGSGKTRILVHKVAALLLLEEVKPEQFLMLTFSRPAAQEVRNRLLDLLGNIAWRLDISTFHSYAFQLLEQPGEQENLKDIVEQATRAIEAGDLPNRSRIESKSVILVDEYQDISEREYAFLSAILNVASESDPPRVIVVGDDDQNIYEFRGSSTRFMREFSQDFESHTYYLETNYRSASNLVAFSNHFATRLNERIKADIELQAHRQETGELSITRYHQRDFYLPLIEQIANHSQALGKISRAVLCATNDEALMLESLLKQRGLPARLLMQLDHFQLKNLLELQLFNYYLQQHSDSAHGLITSGSWQACREKVHKHCQNSRALELLDLMLTDFQSGHEKLYYGDWESWLGEFRWEDVYDREEQGTILVSTMHKAKGKEFDQVWLYLDHYNLRSEADHRAVYVALTRARQELYIHTCHDWFDSQAEQARFETYPHAFEVPRELVLQLSLKDIQLGQAMEQQKSYLKLVAGLPLEIRPEGGFRESATGARISLSGSFLERWQKLSRQGYRPEKAEIGYVVLWFNKHDRKHYRIPLPQISWRKVY